MKKFLIVAAGLLLAGLASDAAPRKGNRIEVVVRGEEGGPWRAYIFGPVCAGKLEVVAAHDVESPIEVVCR